MYFPGDPLFAYDPIYQSVRDPAGARAHDQLVRPGQHEAGVGARATRFDIVLGGSGATPLENA